MKAEHLELLVEEPSMEIFLNAVLPRILAGRATYSIHAYQGKPDLLQKLDVRLRGYARWLPDAYRVIVLVDRDADDCVGLKGRLERAAAQAGLSTRVTCCGAPWRVATRLAIEELEAWFFGEWAAVKAAYPRVAGTVPHQQAYRQPDAIAGGTWEALQRVLQQAAYFPSGLRKAELAGAVGGHFDPRRATSPSFKAFETAVLDAVA
ncbi:DUF4276 family protein [Rhodoplanes azumiensis]|uniref:DUF4276 family protein n=1 Tax=Rhodoplanes azumiensis TaxID=1897628 RepID=A0ABW5AFL7_9BRAD